MEGIHCPTKKVNTASFGIGFGFGFDFDFDFDFDTSTLKIEMAALKNYNFLRPPWQQPAAATAKPQPRGGGRENFTDFFCSAMHVGFFN